MTLDELRELYSDLRVRFDCVNEDGVIYATNSKLEDALDTLAEFPNDTVVIRLA